MANVCLECATPKFMKKAEKGLTHCMACGKNTHTVDAQPRRPLCHDCRHFSVRCTDGVRRPALNYGEKYLSQASCGGGEDTLMDKVGRVVQPKMTRYDYSCPAFKRHDRAPRYPSPNPLTPQERKDWREYLEMPTAFWLEPRRWEGVIDTHREMFWDKGDHRVSRVKVLATGAAIFAGLFIAARKVDTKASSAKSGETDEEIEREGESTVPDRGGHLEGALVSADAAAAG